MSDETKAGSGLSEGLGGWRSGQYPFADLPEGLPCLVRLENGMEMAAFCYKHHPSCSAPDLWDDDWITNDDRCNDKKNGRLYGDQTVVAWKPA